MCFWAAKQGNNVAKTPFSCKRDDLTIRGTEYRPNGSNLPVAIVCHGFMAFQDTVKQYAVELANLGYLTYTFDFCGGSVIKGKSDGATTAMSVLTEVRDLESVADYATSREYADSDNVVLMGCSQGGFVAALVAAKGKYHVNKLILFYPALCIPDDARAGKMMFARFDPNNIPEIIHCGLMTLGRRYATDVIGMDPFTEIMGYKKDVLIVHGGKDKIVNVDYSKRAFDVYRRSDADRMVRLEIIDNGGHGFSKRCDRIAMEILKDFVTS